MFFSTYLRRPVMKIMENYVLPEAEEERFSLSGKKMTLHEGMNPQWKHIMKSEIFEVI